MRRFGVILFGLAFGLGLARPAPVAADSWEMICSGNQLALCASVSMVVSGTTVTMTVTNHSDQLLTSIGLGGYGFRGNPFAPPPLWRTQSSEADGYFNLGTYTSLMSRGVGIGQSFNFSFAVSSGALDLANLTFFANGERLTVAVGGGDDPEEGGTTDDSGLDSFVDVIADPPTNGIAVPEPGTLLLLGAGLMGVAAVRSRRREDNED